MSTNRDLSESQQRITPPSSFVDPPSEEKSFIQAARVLQLLRDRKAGKSITRDPWTCFRLLKGEYDEIRRRVDQDKSLRAYVEDKIRYRDRIHSRARGRQNEWEISVAYNRSYK